MTLSTFRASARLIRTGLLASLALMPLAALLPVVSTPVNAQTPAGSPLQKAQAFYARGDYRASAIELRNAIRANPRDGATRLLSSRVALRLQQGIPAQTEVEAARKAGVPIAETRHLMAEALLQQGKFADALREAQSPGISPALMGEAARVRAMAQLGLRQADQARSEIAQAERLDPTNALIFIDKAKILASQRDFPGSSGAIDRALQLDPRSTRALMIKGDLIRSQTQPPAGLNQALPYFEQALKIDPLSIEARVERAATLVDLRREPEAQQELQRIYKMTPDNPLALYLDAVMKTRVKKFNEANALMTRTKGMLSNYPPALMLEGLVAFELNNIEKANTVLSKAMEMVPGSPIARRLYGSVQIKKNDFDGAIKTFKPLIDAGQVDAQVMALSATAHARKNDFVTASKQFEQALQMAPDNEAIRTQLAMSRIAQGNTSQATQDLQAVLQKNPNSLQALMLITLTDLRTRNFKTALVSAQRFVRAYPNLPLAYNMLGAAYLGINNSNLAEQNFKLALQKKPDYHEARRNLANLYRVSGKYDLARKELQTVLATDRNSVRTMLSLAQVAQSQSRTEETIQWLQRAVQVNPKVIGSRLALANSYLRLGDRQKALVEATAIDRDFPDNPAAVETLAKTQATLQQYPASIGTFTRLNRLLPNSIQATQLLARAYWSAKDYENARRTFQKAVGMTGPGKNLVYLDMLNFEAERGNFSQAVAYANELRKLTPNDSLADSTIGDLYMGAKQWANAAKSYEAARAKANNPKITVNLSTAYLNMGDKARSTAVLKQWLAKRPNDVPIKMAVANNYIAARDYKAAIVEYEAIMKQGNSSPAVLNNLSWALDRVNDPRALSTAARAFKAAPDQPDIADTYGWIMLRKQDKVQGLAILQKAAAKRPNDPNMQYHLAFALKANGRNLEAGKVLDSTLARFKTFDQVNEARALLTQIRSGK
jgi:cellulose synthase operon protein C